MRERKEGRKKNPHTHTQREIRRGVTFRWTTGGREKNISFLSGETRSQNNVKRERRGENLSSGWVVLAITWELAIQKSHTNHWAEEATTDLQLSPPKCSVTYHLLPFQIWHRTCRNTTVGDFLPETVQGLRRIHNTLLYEHVFFFQKFWNLKLYPRRGTYCLDVFVFGPCFVKCLVCSFVIC